MRCLLVCASPDAGPASWISSLAAENDCVIAVDGGGARCLEAGIVPDVLVGDADSLAAEKLAELQSRGVEWISSPRDKDDSDLALALAYARSQGAAEVTVTGAWGGRADHSLAALAALVGAAELRPRILEPDLALWVLTPEARSSLQLAGVGATLSLISYGGAAIVSEEGVKWPLVSKMLEPSTTLGLSNVITDTDIAKVSVSSGTVIVVSERVQGVPCATEV
ncbi:MAG: thiamine diphosphokinase [Coriobacteriia bacterium]